MDTYSSLSFPDLFTWFSSHQFILLLLMAAVPLLWLLVQFRIISLFAGFSIAGGVAMLEYGASEVTVTLFYLALGTLLATIDSSLAQKKLRSTQETLQSMSQQVSTLEATFERWQSTMVRRQSPLSIALLEDKRAEANSSINEETASQSTDQAMTDQDREPPTNVRSIRASGS